MPENFIVKKQITLKASPAEVWEALTNPELTRQYFFKSEVHSDWKVGSSLVFRRKLLGFPFELKGNIEKIEPERLLQYKLINTKLFGKPDPTKYSLVTDELTSKNGSTILSISDNVGNYPGAEKRYERSVKGWNTILSGLKDLVEKNIK